LFDEIITEIINKAKKTVIRPTRRLPFSKKKLKYNNILLYWMLKVKYIQWEKSKQRSNGESEKIKRY